MLLFIIVGIIIFFIYTKKDTPGYKKWMSKIIIKLPIFGELISKIYLARFCGSMEMLLSSKVNMARSILMVKQMIDFYPIQCTLDEIESDIIKGLSLNEALAKHKVYDHRLVYLVKVGEEVNKINTFLGELNKQYNEEVDYKTSIIGSLIEPFLIVFLGIIVGLILIAMYLPLFQLSNNF